MTFLDLLRDIEQMKGKKLRSINAGANIEIVDVNHVDDRVEIKNSKGEPKSRPFTEIQYLWEQLNTLPAIHVDSALAGSGSSRNQPETILANLPYVEHLKIDGKKHISLVDKNSHELGTLREMDSVAREGVKKLLRTRAETRPITGVIIVDDVLHASKAIEELFGTPVEPLKPGIYKKDHATGRILVISNDSFPTEVQVGSYIVVKSRSSVKDGIVVNIDGSEMTVLPGGDLRIIVERS